MCLTFPLLFTAATSSGGLLGVLVCCRDAASMLSFTTGVSLLPQSHLHPCIFNENAEALQSVLHMQLQAACLRAAVYLY